MDRRTFLCGLALGTLCVPRSAEAQQAGKIGRVVFLNDETGGSLPAALFDAFRQGLRELGWVEGQNVVIDYRSARTIDERPGTVAALLTLKPDVIVAPAPAAFTMSPTPTSPPTRGWTPVHGVPIVFLAVSDPVGAKMVASLARPGGTMTGLSYQSLELNTKRLQLLKDAVPSLRRVGVLVHPFHPLRDRIAREIEDAARSHGLDLRFAPVSPPDSPDKLDAAFETLSREGATAIIGLQGPHFYRDRRQLAELTLKHHLPSIFEFVENAVAGALLGYGPSLVDIFRRGASYVDRILKGAKPGDLPIEQPTKFELVINLKTAKALGLTIPPSLLLRADQVIE